MEKNLKGRNFFVKTIIFYNVFKQYAFITTISKKHYSWVSYFFLKFSELFSDFFLLSKWKNRQFFSDFFFAIFECYFFFQKEEGLVRGSQKLSPCYIFFCYLSLHFIKNAIFFHSSIETRVFLNFFFVLKKQGKIELGV